MNHTYNPIIMALENLRNELIRKGIPRATILDTF